MTNNSNNNQNNVDLGTGSYVNGTYTTKNGFSGSGLHCPKGTRLYNTDVIRPVFFMPEDRGATEDFVPLTQEVAPGVRDYYAISNYGRILNTYSGKIMKPNYRPNGYEYYCLAAEDCKFGQKKFNTNRLVMKTFEPREDADKLEVNHINGVKSDNYINKTMEDGTVQSNLEWNSHAENAKHRDETGLSRPLNITTVDVYQIRKFRNQGYSYSMIFEKFPHISVATIQGICKNILYRDQNYTPVNINPYENNTHNKLKLNDKDAERIRVLYREGYNQKEIVEKFYPGISKSTVSDIIRNITHNSRQ